MRKIWGRSTLSIVGLAALFLVTAVIVGFALTSVPRASSTANSPTVPPTSKAQTPAASTSPLATTSTDTVAVKHPAGGKLSVAFAGDSLTGGLFASTRDKGFRWLMESTLSKGGPIAAVSAATPGGTTLEVAEQFEVPAAVDLAVVELGTNDAGNLTKYSDFEQAYSDVLVSVRTASPTAAILCAGVWGSDETASNYDAVIRRSCEAHGGKFVSLRSIQAASGNRGPVGVSTFMGESDDFHPNDAGHQAIADALLSRLAIS